MDKPEFIRLLKCRDTMQEALHERARNVRNEVIGNKGHFRGIIEFSNICEKNCYYCGIRSANRKVERYRMSLDEIRDCLTFIDRAKYGSVVIQSGELTSDGAKRYALDIVRLINGEYPAMGITLSLGEHDAEFLRELKEAGAHRYLLRIESSDPELYATLHPADHSYENRVRTLRDLNGLGYQVGCGNMVGLPGQTEDHLYQDLQFFEEMGFDMFGLGPYVIHEDTPLSTPDVRRWWKKNRHEILMDTLNFLAILRITIPTANIATATALEVFHPQGRIMAMKAGANIFMPSVTPKMHRGKYLLYQNKPCIDEDAGDCHGCSVAKVRAAGLVPALGEQGNSVHFLHRNDKT